MRFAFAYYGRRRIRKHRNSLVYLNSQLEIRNQIGQLQRPDTGTRGGQLAESSEGRFDPWTPPLSARGHADADVRGALSRIGSARAPDAAVEGRDADTLCRESWWQAEQIRNKFAINSLQIRRGRGLHPREGLRNVRACTNKLDRGWLRAAEAMITGEFPFHLPGCHLHTRSLGSARGLDKNKNA